MAIKDNSCILPVDGVCRESTHKLLRHTRKNPATGEIDYFFPMEIEDPIDKEYARLRGYEIGQTLLGYRVINAIMVPCKRKTRDALGREVYINTPSEEQHRIYKALIQDELDKQEEERLDGRCPLPKVSGKGMKRCPRYVKNPAFIPGSDQPKTIANRCEGCKFERFKQAHTTITLSCLDHEGEDGESEAFEVPAPRSNYAGDRYEELAEGFVAYIKEHKPRLLPLAEKLVQEYDLTDAAKELGKSTSTTFSQKEKLKELVTEFLDTVITI